MSHSAYSKFDDDSKLLNSPYSHRPPNRVLLSKNCIAVYSHILFRVEPGTGATMPCASVSPTTSILALRIRRFQKD